MKVAHVRLLAIAVVLRNFPGEEEEDLLNLWETVSFRVFGLCRKDARTQVGGYVRLAWDCQHEKLSSDQIRQRLIDVGSEGNQHSIERAVEHIEQSNCYEGWEEELRYLMYRYEEARADQQFTNEQWNRIWEASASHSIEHICPQDSGLDCVHYLGNLMLLPPGLNSSLKDKRPEDKVKEYRNTGLGAASEVANTIEAEGWGKQQIVAREKSILAWIEKTWA